ncbi:hypothetical protein HW555_002890 [Spodoptera exigua]|uniref:Uncharacterized protein n=1 Tax=Spodoptera exigua TaxID=7107 RepID=A0A835GML1_SPOEX|nr:hypothetical protein HW555_002890 [Spodoptera exigua]
MTGDFNLPNVEWSLSGMGIRWILYNSHKNTNDRILDLVLSNNYLDVAKCSEPLVSEDPHHYHRKFKKYGNRCDYDSFSALRDRGKILEREMFADYIDTIEKFGSLLSGRIFMFKSPRTHTVVVDPKGSKILFKELRKFCIFLTEGERFDNPSTQSVAQYNLETMKFYEHSEKIIPSEMVWNAAAAVR